MNEARFKELLRVPGIGKKSAQRIMESRRKGITFRKLDELKKLGVVTKRAEAFIQMNRSRQTTLF